ncbi:MAG: outer membrane protein assembly factor BamD [Chitinophagales bacterium]|nr:outer membrane protein assembly factor BamD [Chitinophagales bacterium]
MKNRVIFPLICVLFLGTMACNRSYNKVMKNPDPKFRLEKAHEYYNQGKYEKAQPLFEEHLTMNKGIKNSEEVLFLYAYCFYYLKDYSMGAFYFRNFTTSYPTSKRAEESAYMMAKCYEKESPRYQLDQTNTIKAIDQYQNFASRYPNSIRIADANKAIDELRAKLQKKAYESAYLYYKIKQYQAASVSMKALLKDYPGIEGKDKIQYFVVKSNKLYADNSTTSKKLERYEETAKECATFKEAYPNSLYLKEIEDIYSKTLEQIKIFQNSEHNGKEKRRS